MDLYHNAPEEQAPQHVAIIMDGNGRWASARGLPRTVGHQQGAEAVRRSVQAAMELGIPYLTLFGFSAENWQRPASEIEDLMGLLRRYLQSEIAELHKNDIHLRVIGERERLPRDIVALIGEAESQHNPDCRLNLTIALSYGGRQEILEAARKLAEAVQAGRLEPSSIDQGMFERQLATAGMPDPDLLIRTSGEQRISNFLLWQSAYCELVFIRKLWPDFDKGDFCDALEEFHRRDRRYGTAVGSG